MKYTLENELLKLTVNGEGGSMTSLIYKPENEERLWQGDERWWKGRDVVIFPIVGHAGEFVAKGKTCLLKSHGLIRYSTLTVRQSGRDFITLSLSSSEESLKSFPYKWLFEISYKLVGATVEVSYFVKSLAGVMPFYVGGHPGMKAKGGRATISFENEETPLVYPVGKCGAYPVGKIKSFVADKAFFAEHKTYQLGSLSGGAVYAETDDGYLYTYRSDCPLYAFWSNEQGGDYICVEPWWGINDFDGAPAELSLKPFINFDNGKGFTCGYALTIEKV